MIPRRLPPRPRSASLRSGRNKKFGEAARARAASHERRPTTLRVARFTSRKENTMSRKTSTAALDIFRQRFLRNPRRVPHHPAGEKLTEIRPAQLGLFQEEDMRGSSQKGQTRSFRAILPVVLRIAFSLVIWTLGDRMNIDPPGYSTLSLSSRPSGCRLPQPEVEGSDFHSAASTKRQKTTLS